jgi:hypothetical protein
MYINKWFIYFSYATLRANIICHAIMCIVEGRCKIWLNLGWLIAVPLVCSWHQETFLVEPQEKVMMSTTASFPQLWNQGLSNQ